MTAVDAVRRKRKADVRLWVGFGDEGIVGPGKRKDERWVLGVFVYQYSACYRLGYFAKARLLALLLWTYEPLISHREHPAR